MLNNDILRRVRFALDLPDAHMSELVQKGGATATAEELFAFSKKVSDEASVPCPEEVLTALLDGLILDRRGPPREGTPTPPTVPLTNNLVLKKLRIALELKEGDMLEILEAGEQPMSRHELTALFRKPEHKHFREAGDQVLRHFLKGLSLRMRQRKNG